MIHVRIKETYPISRRDWMKQVSLLGAAAAAVRSSSQLLAGDLPPGQLPKIKLGNLEVSRLILGSNPFFGWAHGNPQGSDKEMRAYYTDAQVMSVLDAAAVQGITAVWTPCYPPWIRLWNEYQGSCEGIRFMEFGCLFWADFCWNRSVQVEE
jgi:hypothetical protein